MILPRQKAFATPLAVQLALRNQLRPGTAEAAVSRLTRTASRSNMNPDLTTIIKRKFPAKVAPAPPRAELRPVSVPKTNLQKQVKAVNIALPRPPKSIVGFNPTTTFV